MLASIAGAIAPLLVNKLADVFIAYQNKQITLAELQAEIAKALMECFATVAKAEADALTKTFSTFGEMMRNSRIVRIVWAIVVLSQLAVLLWLQVGISAFVYVYGGTWPSAGATGDWAYLLLSACLGLGPVVLNSGPGKINADNMKASGK